MYFVCVRACVRALGWRVDTFTDTAISSSRVNGEHREKVLQRWEAGGGDSNGESYDLEADAVSSHLPAF